jgi:type IV pilus assembly protein PilA
MRQLLKNKLKEQKGLTLIELLAVIVILGIIAAIAIPSINNVISNTKEKAKVAEALQLIDAARLAYADNSSVTKWKQTADATNGYGGLSTYVSKVSDQTYEVLYDGSTYKIKGHNSATVVNSTYTDTNEVTETELANKAK